jgi:hypothetical protein
MKNFHSTRFFSKFLLPIIAAVTTGGAGNSLATPSGHGCTKGIVLSSITFTLTTKTSLGNEVEIKDPRTIIKDYIESRANDDTEQATKAKGSFTDKMLEACKLAKKYAEYVGFAAEIFASNGMIVDEIRMDVSYDCCDGTNTTSKDALGDKSDLFLTLRSTATTEAIAASLKALPQLYIDVMVEAADQMVRNCPKE